MDSEAIIAARLKNSIPADSVYQPPAPIVDQPNTTNGQATTATEYKLDEMTAYKLHDLFGAQYDPKDTESVSQLSYIYEEVAKMVPEPDYTTVSAKIRDLQRIAGITNSDARIYRLYQWLRLNNVRRTTEIEMENLRDG